MLAMWKSNFNRTLMYIVKYNTCSICPLSRQTSCFSNKYLPRNRVHCQWSSLVMCSSVSKERSAEWPIVRMQLNTCARLYEYWHEIKVTKTKPLRGVDFDVAYLDTWPMAPPDAPVILALHGLAYSHQFILPLLPYLLQNRVRVIAPNFPGCGLTPGDPEYHFSHTSQERAQFVAQFLDALDINKVDMLISHSAALYTSLYLVEQKARINSLVLLSPGGLKPINKYWIKMHIYLVLSYLIRNLGLEILLKPFERFLRWLQPNVQMTMDQIDSSVKTLIYADYDLAGHTLENLGMGILRIPVLLLYSKDDHQIKHGIHTVVEGLDVQKSTYYDANLNMSGSSPTPQDLPYAIIFETGKHEIETSHSKIIGEAIGDLFNYVKNRKV